MKKLLLFTAALGMFSGVFAKKVRFQVDMSGQTVSTNGVHIAGDFQSEVGVPGGDWQPGATSLSKVGSTSIYSIVVDIPAGRFYEFKFINGNNWPDAENVPALNQKGHPNNGQSNGNRWFYIDSLANDTTDLPAYLFAGSAPAGKNAVRFAVDLKNETVASDGVLIAGDFTNWGSGQRPMTSLYSDKVYEYIAILDTGMTYGYKFKNGDAGWESVPSTCATNGNRTVVSNASKAETKVCFNSCTACPAAPLPRYDVTFRVDMSNSNCDGGFDSVTVAGARSELTNWGSGVKLNQVGSSNVYSTVIELDSGEVKFKFRFHKNGNTNWEGGGDRTYVLKQDSVLAANCFGSSSPCVPKPAPSRITFKVDMSNEVPDPQGRIYVMGTFQTPNWQAGALRLNPVAGEPGVFAITVNNVCPGSFNYKFLNGDSSLQASEETYPDTASRACLEPNGLGGFNRKYTRTDTAAIVLAFVYNKCATISVGLNKVSGAFSEVVLYPNPAQEFATLNLSSVKGEVTLTVVDIAGRVLKNMQTQASEVKLSKEELGNGLFFVRLTGTNGESRVMKLIVQ